MNFWHSLKRAKATNLNIKVYAIENFLSMTKKKGIFIMQRKIAILMVIQKVKGGITSGFLIAAVASALVDMP